MNRAFAALVAVTLAVWACTVDRKTDKLACTTTADCSSGRTCSAGYCVTDGAIDAAVCPSECTSCDSATGACNITGSGAAISCPPAWSCNVTCTTAQPCGVITCGATACAVSCTGSGACAATSCASSCKCDVTCTPLVGACGTMTCPVKPGNKSCTTGGVPGAACDSTAFMQCHSCP